MDTFLPLPDEVLDNGPGVAASLFERDGITRRQALAGAGGLAIAAAAMPKFGATGMFEAAQAQAADNPNAHILVSIYCDGGNDGLNTLVPVQDTLYASKRSRVGIDPNVALPLAGPNATDQFRWHPSLTGLAELYDAGKVAVLPAVDYTPSDQSHFNSQIFWRTGVVGITSDQSGWMGRLVDRIGVANNPLQAISIGWGLDPMLLSRAKPVATVFDPASFQLGIPDVWSVKSALTPYRGSVSGARNRARRSAQAAMRNAIGVYDRLGPLRAQQTPPPTPRPYPDTNLGKGLRHLARMLGAGLGTRLAAVSQSGYDTHIDQPTRHGELLQDLGNSLAAWQADLDARGLSNRVTTMVWSEFGRRVEDNDSNGTDHGAGGLVVLVGNHVRGGIRSEFPGLSRLDEDGNLRVTTQFRTLYSSVLEGWMGVDAGAVLPRIGTTRIPLFT